MDFELSDYQKEIKKYFIIHPHDNMYIEALAGSGKTSTALMLTNLSHSSDVYIAFNKSIQTEMKEKLKNPKTKCYTIHGLCLSVMAYNLKEIYNSGYKLDNFKIYKIISKLTNKYFKDIKNISENKLYLQENYSSLYNIMRLTCSDYSESSISKIVEEYGLFGYCENCIMPDNAQITTWVKEIDQISQTMFNNEYACDFTDMLYITLKKIENKEWKIPFWLLFTNLYCDESQDFSMIQLKLIKYFKRTGGRFIFILDKNQAIYGFAGASCNSYSLIKKMYAPLKEFKLPINYRCGSKILDLVNEKFNIGIIPRPQCPTGTVNHIYYDELPLKVNENDFVLSRKNSDLINVIYPIIKQGKSIYFADKEILNNILNFIKKNNEILAQDLYNKILSLKSNTEKKIIDSDLESIEMIITLYNNFIKTENSKSTEAFIRYIQKIINVDNPKNSIRLLSIHKSKGLEADNVFVLNKAEPFYGLAHSSDMRQQEQNLSYIAITRAKNNLYLVGTDGNK